MHMSYKKGLPTSRLSSPISDPFNRIDDVTTQWRLLGRASVNFVKEMRQFADCPANILYWDYDPMAQQFAKDMHNAMKEAGWNVTLGPESKKIEGIKIVTRSQTLHAEEISSVVAYLRAVGFDAKVRVRPELETESVQIAIGAIPGAPQENQS